MKNLLLVLFTSIGLCRLVAQDDTFICNGDLIITLSDSGLGGATNAFNIELNGSAASFGSLADYPIQINSSAFNSIDGYIYGITQGEEIIRLKNDGTFDNTGRPSFLPFGSFSAAGDFDENGIYWIHHRGDQSYYGIDVNNGNSLVDRIELQWHPSSGNSGKFEESIDDLAFDPLNLGSMYTYQRGWDNFPTNGQATIGHLLRADLDPSSPTYGFIFSEGRLAASEITHLGAMFFDSQGYLFGYGDNAPNGVNSQNRLVRIDRDPAVANLVAIGPGASANDGCSCPFSMFITKRTPDSYNVCYGEPIEVTYEIGNTSKTEPGGAVFTDTFPTGFVIEDIIFDEVFGIVRPGTGIGTNKLIIDGINFTNKVVEFTVKVRPSLVSATYEIYADLTNLPQRFGSIIYSDDPETFASNDPTIFIVDYEQFQSDFDIGEDVVMCEGEIANFTATSPLPNTEIIWSTGETGVFASTAESGMVIATAELGVCFDADTVNVEVVPYPIIDLGVDLQPCATTDPTTTLAVPDIAGQSVTWSTSETTSSIEISESGTYSVEVDDRGCKTTDEINVDIIFENYELFLPNLQLCEGEGVNINVNNPWPVSTEWTFPSGAVSNSSVLYIEETVASESGMYSVEMEYLGCPYIEEFDLLVTPYPIAELDSIVRPCYDALETTLSVPTNANYTYIWSTGETVPSITVTESGTYEVEVEDNGCNTTAIGVVDFVFEEFVESFPDETLCEGDSINILAENEFPVDYLWTLPDGSEVLENNIDIPSITEEEAGNFRLQMIYNQCIFDTDFNINVNPQPEIELDNEITYDICDSLTLNINEVTPGTTIEWMPADIVNCQNCETTTAMTTQDQLIIVRVVDDIGCEASDSIYLNVEDTGLGEQTNIPNIFSPNGDRNNDFFVITPLCYRIERFEIFDRWGNNVYSLDDHPGATTVEWDGRNHVGDCTEGVYTWMGEFTFINSGLLKTMSGDVTIFR